VGRPLGPKAQLANSKRLAKDSKQAVECVRLGGFPLSDILFLYRIHIQGDIDTSLAFTSNSLRMVDVRDTQSNAWEPLVLVSQDSDSNGSEPSDSVLIRQAPDDIEVPVLDQSSSITALYCCEESGIAFCGRSNGRVDTCKLHNPENTMRNVYKYRGGLHKRHMNRLRLQAPSRYQRRLLGPFSCHANYNRC
jgi:hypothetical protein